MPGHANATPGNPPRILDDEFTHPLSVRLPHQIDAHLRKFKLNSGRRYPDPTLRLRGIAYSVFTTFVITRGAIVGKPKK